VSAATMETATAATMETAAAAMEPTPAAAQPAGHGRGCCGERDGQTGRTDRRNFLHHLLP
jgi:hypothetical protein